MSFIFPLILTISIFLKFIQKEFTQYSQNSKPDLRLCSAFLFFSFLFSYEDFPGKSETIFPFLDGFRDCTMKGPRTCGFKGWDLWDVCLES